MVSDMRKTTGWTSKAEVAAVTNGRTVKDGCTSDMWSKEWVPSIYVATGKVQLKR